MSHPTLTLNLTFNPTSNFNPNQTYKLPYNSLTHKIHETSFEFSHLTPYITTSSLKGFPKTNINLKTTT